MNSKKVFLVTMFEGNNFGSSLQAFSLKKTIANISGFDCLIVARREKGFVRILYLIKRKIRILFKLILHPSQFKRNFKDYINKNKLDYYDDNTVSYFESFTNEYLNVQYKTFKELKKESRSDDCFLCICGSDQIWNPTPIILSEMNYLSFSPDSKKNSYACSLGTNCIPKFNKNDFVRKIKKFKNISVRENTASRILNDLNINSTVCVDPTIMVGLDFWKRYLHKINGCFDFLYFVNCPSQCAISNLNSYYSSKNKKVVVLCKGKIDFNFKYEVCKGCSPFDFINYIFNADNVFTDSYHGTTFSTLFNKKFITFLRNYKNSVPQNSRIKDFLKSVGLESNYIDKNIVDLECILDNTNFMHSNLFIEEARVKSILYLEETLSESRQ